MHKAIQQKVAEAAEEARYDHRALLQGAMAMRDMFRQAADAIDKAMPHASGIGHNELAQQATQDEIEVGARTARDQYHSVLQHGFTHMEMVDRTLTHIYGRHVTQAILYDLAEKVPGEEESLQAIAAQLVETCFEGRVEIAPGVHTARLRLEAPDWLFRVADVADLGEDPWKEELAARALITLAAMDDDQLLDPDFMPEFADGEAEMYTEADLRHYLASSERRRRIVKAAVADRGHSERGELGDIAMGVTREVEGIFRAVRRALLLEG